MEQAALFHQLFQQIYPGLNMAIGPPNQNTTSYANQSRNLSDPLVALYPLLNNSLEDNCKLKRKLEQLEKNESILKSKVNELEKKLKDTGQLLEKEKAENKKLQTNFESVKKQIEDLDSELIDKQNFIDEKEGGIELMSSQIFQLKSQIETDEQEISDLQAQIRSVKELYNNLAKTHEGVMQKMNTVQSDLCHYVDYANYSEKALKKMDGTIKRLEAKIVELEQKNCELSESKERSDQDCYRLRIRLDGMKTHQLIEKAISPRGQQEKSLALKKN